MIHQCCLFSISFISKLRMTWCLYWHTFLITLLKKYTGMILAGKLIINNRLLFIQYI